MRIFEETDNHWRVSFTAEDFPQAAALQKLLPHTILPPAYFGESQDSYLLRLFSSAIKNGNSIVCHIDSILIQTQKITQLEVVMQRFPYFAKIESRISQEDIMHILNTFSLSEEGLCYYLATVIMTLNEEGFYVDEKWTNEFIVGGLLTATELPDYDALAKFSTLGLILKDKTGKKYEGSSQGVAMWTLLNRNPNEDVGSIVRDKISSGIRDTNGLLAAINSMPDITQLKDLPLTLSDELFAPNLFNDSEDEPPSLRTT